MALQDYIFTSESVSEGHPDKVCDQISDAILDAFIANDMKLGVADDSHANTRLGCRRSPPPTRSSSPAGAPRSPSCTSTAGTPWSTARR